MRYIVMWKQKDNKHINKEFFMQAKQAIKRQASIRKQNGCEFCHIEIED